MGGVTRNLFGTWGFIQQVRGASESGSGLKGPGARGQVEQKWSIWV